MDSRTEEGAGFAAVATIVSLLRARSVLVARVGLVEHPLQRIPSVDAAAHSLCVVLLVGRFGERLGWHNGRTAARFDRELDLAAFLEIVEEQPSRADRRSAGQQAVVLENHRIIAAEVAHQTL